MGKRRHGSKGGKKRSKAQNTAVSSRAGQGGNQDRGVTYGAQRNSSHPLYRGSYFTQSREWGRWYYTSWEARKIVHIPVEDMLRKKWKYDGLSDSQAKAFRGYTSKLNLMQTLKRALIMERLLGGAVILMGVADKQDDPGIPLNYKSVRQGDLKFINPISRRYVQRVEYVSDPFSPEFGRVEYYTINGVKTHHSRLMVFDGEPLSYQEHYDLGIPSIQRDGFGQSVLAPIWDDLVRATGSRQAALHLVSMASVLLIKAKSLSQYMATEEGNNKLAQLDEIAEQMSMYQAAVIDGEDTDVAQWSATFGSVPELLMSYLQVLSAASDIPATRFIGQAPGGLNATGESDLENYYNMIDAKREDRLAPQLEKFMHVAFRSFFGESVSFDDIELEHPPLWNMSETELAAIRTQDVANVAKLVEVGVMDENEAVEELKERDALKVDVAPFPSSAEELGEFAPEPDLTVTMTGDDDAG